MSISGDSHLARLVVSRKLCTADEVEKVLVEIRSLAKSNNGSVPSLKDVLVQRGLVTSSQIDRLLMPVDEDSMYRPAQQIPGFQILSKLGQGAMAVVFKAKQLSLDRTVAVKVLPRRLSENKEFVERFYREGRAAAKLNHPNIVQAYDVGEAGGYHYFVMEYIDGKTVYDLLTGGKPLGESEALQIIIQTAQALEHAHNQGFIHRDVKPKNIMLTKSGDVKLADMGLAREMRDFATAAAEAGRAYGTPYYISPEQIRGELHIDARADVYALGATFYHMVAGKVPFDGTTPSAVMHKHLKEPLVPPDHLNHSLSAGVGEIIEFMMAKKPDDRYAAMKELVDDLNSVAQGEPPFQARKKYDRSLLETLANDGEVIENPDTTALRLQQLQQQPKGVPVPWLMLLGAGLVVSVLINMILIILLAGKH